MKIIYFSKRADFISSLKSKIAHISCQIRASLLHGKKIKFSRIFDFILKRKYCTLIDQSFFTLFAIQILSINTKHHGQPATRNPSSSQTLILAKKFQETWKIVFQNPATFSPNKPFHRAQRVSLSKYTLLALIKPSRIEAYTYIHIQLFLIFAFDYSACVNCF